jgi:ribosomal protein S18 acetylase RimI-like enzyme
VAVREQYRGRGLQVILSNLAENELIDRGFMTTLATVHPDNVFSLNNLFESGYRIIKKDEFYGGQPRFLVFKKLIK